MPREEHLPQAGRALPRRGRAHGAHARPAGLTRAILLALTLLALAFALPIPAGASAQPAAGAATLPPATRIEAVRSGWDAAAPPADGWVPVTLPDSWTQRWPDFDGVVWYRLRWTEDSAPAPRGLMIEYFNMAGAVYVNGSLVSSDRHLAEPLSRSWNRPRMWVIDAPLLKAGSNELLVRVSGLAAYQPGLGPVLRGTPAGVETAFAETGLLRRSIQWLGMGLTLVMAVTYGMLWLLRRSEVSYGWFALFSLAWLPYSYNYIAVEAWPFSSTIAFQRMTLLALLASIWCFLQFALHFCRFRLPLLQRIAGALCALAAAGLVLAPSGPILADARIASVIGSLCIFLLSSALIIVHAWRSRAADAVALALCTLLPQIAGVHDTLVFMEILPGNRYYVTPSSSAMLLGISFVLTWRLVAGMRLVEHFNAELQRRVDDATLRLSGLLHGQHMAELLQTRLNERLNLVRDLHDGLGMTLSAHISQLRAQAQGGGMHALHALEEVNADLRLIIESSALEDDDDLAARLAPLRHRTTRIFEAAGIACRWEVQALDGCRIDGRRALDFLRLLQEALANVLRHSGADRVDIGVDARGGHLALTVSDNGRGLQRAPGDAAPAGLGLRSMHARAARLCGTLALESTGRGTQLRMRCPIEEPLPASA
jgi:signal transduction histidine kinase